MSTIARRISSSLTSTKSSSRSRKIRCGSSKETRVARPSAAVAVAAGDGLPVRQASYAAGAASDWTPITSISARVAFATTHAPAAPLPPPIGTRMASIRGWSSRSSSVPVPTPAMSSGSFPEWM